MKTLLYVVRLSLALVAGALSAQQPIDYACVDIYSGQDGHRFHPTVREECRSVVFDSEDGVYTIGVQSNGSDTRNANSPVHLAGTLGRRPLDFDRQGQRTRWICLQPGRGGASRICVRYRFEGGEPMIRVIPQGLQ